MATHSSILAWRTLWTEEPGELQSIGSQSQTQLKWLRMDGQRYPRPPTSVQPRLAGDQGRTGRTDGLGQGWRKSSGQRRFVGLGHRPATNSYFTDQPRWVIYCFKEETSKRGLNKLTEADWVRHGGGKYQSDAGPSSLLLILRQTGRLPQRWALSEVTGSQVSVCAGGHRGQQAVTGTSSSYCPFHPICNHRARYPRLALVLGYTPLNWPCCTDRAWPFRTSSCTCDEATSPLWASSPPSVIFRPDHNSGLFSAWYHLGPWGTRALATAESLKGPCRVLLTTLQWGPYEWLATTAGIPGGHSQGPAASKGVRSLLRHLSSS